MKLWRKLNANGIHVGRDELYRLLRAHSLLVEHRKKYVVTTNSTGWHSQFPNLLKGTHVERVNQVWVSDITYLETKGGFVYLSLVTDVYCRKIMGWFVHDKLDSEGPLNALYRAFLQVDGRSISGLIHHSDRGWQYCSGQYTNTLMMKGIKTSMTQDGSPYDNAIAERVNGILKAEWLELEEIQDIKQAKKRVEEVVWLYNNERPHFSIGLNTPDTVYQRQEEGYGFIAY